DGGPSNGNEPGSSKPTGEQFASRDAWPHRLQTLLPSGTAVTAHDFRRNQSTVMSGQVSAETTPTHLHSDPCPGRAVPVESRAVALWTSGSPQTQIPTRAPTVD